jgi:large subunit ribosomal protein L15
MLDRLTPRPGASRSRKRAGRGPGGPRHKTAGRGVKGQGKRSAGRETPFWFEGGQMPMARRVPKRGFRSRSHQAVAVVNVRTLLVFGEGSTVDPELLAARGLVRQGLPVKLLADGEVPKSLTVKVHRASAAARRKVEEAGGSVEILS